MNLWKSLNWNLKKLNSIGFKISEDDFGQSFKFNLTKQTES